VTITRTSAHALVFVLLCVGGFAQNAGSKILTVRGILQKTIGVGSDTTGVGILLDGPIRIDDASVNLLEIPASTPEVDKLLSKYVEATGTIVYRTGVERGKWPVLQVNNMKELQPDGKAERDLGQRLVSLSLEPAEIVWKNIAGQSSEVQPKLTFSIMNNSRSDLVLQLKTVPRVCFATRNVETREDVWHYPEHLSDLAKNVVVKPGETFSESIVLPEKAAPSPGTYIVKGAICGNEEYQLTSQFVVGAS